MLKSTEHLRDLTRCWFVSPFPARFNTNFGIDGSMCCSHQLDLLSCVLKAASARFTPYSVSCGVWECRADSSGTVLAASCSLANPLRAPTLQPPGQSLGRGMCPSCPHPPKQTGPRCDFPDDSTECKSPLPKTMVASKV